MIPTLESYWTSVHRKHWLDAAEALGVTLPDATVYEPTLSGLEAYMAAAGIKYFSAPEAVRPHQQWPSLLIPPQCAWIALAVLGAIADHMRELAGRPVKLRNWWRPEDYNELAAKGAPYTDHLWAVAFDLDFTGPWWKAVFARRKAQRWLTKKSGIALRFISLGVGWRTLHVGLFAPRTLVKGRHRRWKYGKLPTTEKYL